MATAPNLHIARDVLLGTAVGDALGLPFEGLSTRAVARRRPRLDRFTFLGRRGVVSDDTQLSVLLAAALVEQPASPERAVACFRRSLVLWLLSLPWGVGLGTLRACVRALLGVRPSGVASAGNGAAMRAAIVGVLGPADRTERGRWSDALAAVTHVDVRAIEGARFVAELAALAARRDVARPEAIAARALEVVTVPELRDAIGAALELARAPTSPTPATLAAALGNTGYVVHSVALTAAIFACWGDDAARALSACVLAGGDTDTHAAIVGAWLGARHGRDALPLVAALEEGAFGPARIEAIVRGAAPGWSVGLWARATAWNLALYPWVLLLGLGLVLQRE